MKSYKEVEKDYIEKSNGWKNNIRSDTKPVRRFFRWILYGISFPWVWLFYNMRDWRTAICVIISFALWSGTVWIFFLLYWITGNVAIMSIGVGVWAWWLSPVGSPFILLVTATAIGMKAAFNKIKHRRSSK